MATGDSNDILRRIKLVLPPRWFDWTAPLRDAVLGGISDGAAWCYSWIVYAQTQARLATTTGPWLDIYAYDFLNRNLLRSGKSDHVFRTLIQATVLQERVTRAGMIRALTALTASQPTIFEPWNTFDTGAYGVAASGLGYGSGGGWGSMQLPGQVFIKVVPGVGIPITNVGGYGDYIGGYGVGSSVEYVSPAEEAAALDTAQIINAIVTTKPTGVIAWTQITASNKEPWLPIIESFAF